MSKDNAAKLRIVKEGEPKQEIGPEIEQVPLTEEEIQEIERAAKLEIFQEFRALCKECEREGDFTPLIRKIEEVGIENLEALTLNEIHSLFLSRFERKMPTDEKTIQIFESVASLEIRKSVRQHNAVVLVSMHERYGKLGLTELAAACKEGLLDTLDACAATGGIYPIEGVLRRRFTHENPDVYEHAVNALEKAARTCRQKGARKELSHIMRHAGELGLSREDKRRVMEAAGLARNKIAGSGLFSSLLGSLGLGKKKPEARPERTGGLKRKSRE